MNLAEAHAPVLTGQFAAPTTTTTTIPTEVVRDKLLSTLEAMVISLKQNGLVSAEEGAARSNLEVGIRQTFSGLVQDLFQTAATPAATLPQTAQTTAIPVEEDEVLLAYPFT